MQIENFYQEAEAKIKKQTEITKDNGRYQSELDNLIATEFSFLDSFVQIIEKKINLKIIVFFRAKFIGHQRTCELLEKYI